MKYLLILLPILLACSPQGPTAEQSHTDSLTSASYTGKKYYFGWGAAGRGDPSMMHNEVKYDVLHTHNIFTDQIGGKYQGIKEIGADVGGSRIGQRWDEIGSQIGKDDMYIQYSSGHGYPAGLGVGVTYAQMRDRALSFGAKETVIFTMACHSGGLVNSFKQKAAELESMKRAGKTLFVMASSSVAHTSATGPGRDSAEPGAPFGSAGSAFGHALWKALAGEADGFIDGVKDGFIDMSEIEAYATARTLRIGGHTPVTYGFNYENLIMNEVPSQTYLANLDGGTGDLSDAEVRSSVTDMNEHLWTGEGSPN